MRDFQMYIDPRPWIPCSNGFLLNENPIPKTQLRSTPFFISIVLYPETKW